MSEGLNRCSTCKNGYLKPTGEVVVKGESIVQISEVGSKRVYQCDNCKKRRITIGMNEYVIYPPTLRQKYKQTFRLADV